MDPPLVRLVADLPATVPFVGPEALERRTGRPFQLRLGANESLFGPSPQAAEAMRAAVEQVALYGDPENAELRSELARAHGVAVENVTVASGIDDLLGLAVRAFVEPGVAAVTSLGAYPTFNYHVDGYGGHLERVPYRQDPSAVQACTASALTESKPYGRCLSCTFLCAGINSTGTVELFACSANCPNIFFLAYSLGVTSSVPIMRQIIPQAVLYSADEAA
jgi:histidinol-phosphate/aromatic aminotransferase/cobyric acid decarboxylase-like protein